MSDRRRYELLSTLGAGGFGTVYQARLLGGGGFTKKVALKLPHPERADDPDVGRRLREEARMLGLVRHRAIVHVDSLVLLNGSWTVVMEYVEGVDLTRALSAGPLPLRVALGIVEEVVGALHVAYTTRGPDGEELRLVHRDIKPSNVLVTAAGEVKVLDFGIARADLDPLEVTTLTNAGSRLYMSPERLDGIDDPRADVYSLGAVLFELLTGRAFGKTSGHPERHAQRLTLALAHLRAVLGSEGDGAARLVAEMLAYDPEARPWPREVERRAADLAAQVGGPRLRDWAEANVPGLLAARPSHDPFRRLVLAEQTEEEASRCDPMALTRVVRAPDEVDLDRPPSDGVDVAGDAVEDVDLQTRPAFEASSKDDSTTIRFVGPEDEVDRATDTGAPPRVDHVLVDATGTPAPRARVAAAAPAPVATDASGTRWARVAVGIAAGAAGLLALLLWGLSRERGVEAEPLVDDPAGALAVAPARAPAAVVPPLEPPAPREAAAPRETAMPRATAASAPEPAPGPADPRPAGPPRWKVDVGGDAASVALVADGRRYALPASVPDGDYAIEATFGERQVVGGRLAVAGGPAKVTCRALFLRCTAE